MPPAVAARGLWCGWTVLIERDKAKAAMDKAAAELATTGPAKLANSDAVALAAYLQGLGIGIDADRANKLLVLLAVLVIECGGGLALAVGIAQETEQPRAWTFAKPHRAGVSVLGVPSS